MQSLAKHVALLIVAILLVGVLPLAHAPVANADLTCLMFSATGTISGIVTGSDGAPLDHVAVSAYATDSHSVYRQTTPSPGYTSGIFAFKDIPIGTYVLYFRPSNDDQSEWYLHQPDASSATAITLTPDQTVNVSVQLRAGAHFNVTVRDPDGVPVTSSQVIVYDADGNPAADGVTDAQGVAHTAPGLPVGAYRLYAGRGSHSDLLPGFYNDKPTLERADSVTIPQGQTSVDAQITLRRGAKLSGTLTDATSGAPLGLALVVMQGPNDFFTTAATDASGHYSASGLPGGLYWLSFIPLGTAEQRLIQLRRIITLTPPNALDRVDAALTQGGAISGTITAPDGTPLQNVQVFVSGVGDDTGYARTDAQGKYTVGGLPSGMYAVRFSDPRTELDTYYGDQHDPARVSRVAVTAPNTTAGINAVLALGGTISGRVVDDHTGAPLSRVTVYVRDPDQPLLVRHVLTGADGTYTTGPVLASGSYLVRFEPGPSSTSCVYGQMFYGATSSATSPRVKVSAPGTVANVDASMELGSLLYGTVTDAATGRPIEGAGVSVYDDGGQLVASTSTNLLGRYQTSTALLPGAYRLEFGRGDYMTTYSGGAHTLDAAQPVMVPAQSTGLDAALAHGGTLEGHVTAADTGAPLEHALVTLYGADDHVIDSTETAFDGSYGFERLPSGTYRLGAAPAQTLDGFPILRGYGSIFSGGASSLSQAQPVSLAAPQRVGIDLAMPKGQAQSPGWHIHLALIQR
jgi:5-hydroxyisourate hydrolase-like protein (transthyretin family)